MAFDEVYSQQSTPSETELIQELAWCPECQSPPSSDYAHVRYCTIHMPGSSGESDRLVDSTRYLHNGDAGGPENKAVCDFLHRSRTANKEKD